MQEWIYMIGKMRTTLYLSKEIVEKAKKVGFNISKTCENALKKVN
ncbi:hypothetical protein DRO66_07605 [Candidatus Bathyarchaeota archaeon]|nr:MAG: hypothetical protein DRO66_07605 [Candidatus Bathyarchaeota archaeon]